MPERLVDAVAVLQRGRLTVELLGEPVEVRKAPQQVLPTRLPELRVAHEALHQVQPALANTLPAVTGRAAGRACTFAAAAAHLSSILVVSRSGCLIHCCSSRWPCGVRHLFRSPANE